MEIAVSFTERLKRLLSISPKKKLRWAQEFWSPRLSCFVSGHDYFNRAVTDQNENGLLAPATEHPARIVRQQPNCRILGRLRRELFGAQGLDCVNPGCPSRRKN
jgi:hypothetical protein